MHPWIQTYIHTPVYIHSCTYIYSYIHTYTCIYTHTHTYMHTYIYIYMYMSTYRNMCIGCIHTCVHTYIHNAIQTWNEKIPQKIPHFLHLSVVTNEIKSSNPKSMFSNSHCSHVFAYQYETLPCLWLDFYGQKVKPYMLSWPFLKWGI